MIAYFARHPTAANLLMLIALLLGFTALPKMQRDSFPVTPPTEVGITLKYAGASPAEIENTICLPLEEALDAVADLFEIRCDARENKAIGTASMRIGADMGEFFNDVKDALDAVSVFPERAEKPVVEKLERVAVVAGVMMTGDVPPSHLFFLAEKVRVRMKRHPMIAQVKIKGFSDRQILIEVPRDVARRYKLTLGDIANAVRQQSVDMPTGQLQAKDGDLLVRFTDERRSPEQFKSLMIKSSIIGGQVRLSDIATIKVVFEYPEDKIIFNGKRAALLEVSKTSKQDALRVMEAIQQVLKKEREIAPKSITFKFSQDVTSNIRDRLRILFDNGLQGLVLVFLTMWLFFGLRFSFWVAMGLPVSFLGATFFMFMMGLTINMMTMVALIVAIGLLMDDAIVISENVATRFKQGASPSEAAIKGVTQVMPGVLSSFLTTVIFLTPIMFMAGRIGAVLKYIPVILVATLLVSLVEAFLILPAHLNHSLKHGKRELHGFRAWFERGFERFRLKRFGPFADWALRWRYFVLGLALLAFLASYATVPAGILKFRAFPQLESDIIQARILLPQGTPLKRTEAVVERVTAALKKVDDEFSKQQSNKARLVRNTSILYNTNVDSYESGAHIATVSADLLRAEQRTGSINDMLNRWRELTGDVPDVIALKFTDRERGVAGKAIDIRLHDKDLARLKSASYELQKWLSSFRGVLDLSDDLRPGKPEIRLKLSDSAILSGMTARKIAEEVRASLFGKTGLTVQAGRETRDIIVRLKGSDRQTLGDLEDIAVTGPGGKLVPLLALAKTIETRDYARIHRVNGARTLTVQGKLDTRIANAREIMGATKKKFLPQLKKKYPGLRVSFVGQGKEASTTGNSLQTNVLIGFIGVFIMLAWQFSSFIQPLVVIIAMPLGFIGVVIGHLLLGYELSMPSLVGLATLAGVVVNDSILLVVFIKRSIKEGMSVVNAAAKAARERFRAVLLTSITTIMGLLPLLMETSTQAQFMIPLVISLAFGLLVATMMSLIVVPVFFTILDDFSLINHQVEKSKTENGSVPASK